jgi:hypothetical protein
LRPRHDPACCTAPCACSQPRLLLRQLLAAFGCTRCRSAGAASLVVLAAAAGGYLMEQLLQQAWQQVRRTRQVQITVLVSGLDACHARQSMPCMKLTSAAATAYDRTSMRITRQMADDACAAVTSIVAGLDRVASQTRGNMYRSNEDNCLSAPPRCAAPTSCRRLHAVPAEIQRCK